MKAIGAGTESSSCCIAGPGRSISAVLPMLSTLLFQSVSRWILRALQDAFSFNNACIHSMQQSARGMLLDDGIADVVSLTSTVSALQLSAAGVHAKD